MTDKTPYLSIVVISRNDDHGGNLLQRMQQFIDSLCEQCNHYRLETELIIVEWNPPQNRKSLFDVLVWPKDRQYLTIRIITVPEELHKRFNHSDKIPLFQMIGKNVGIRRARGRFVLATNIDITFSDELMKFISKRQLRYDVVYRANRIDIDSVFPNSKILRTNTKYYILNFQNLEALAKEIIGSPSLIGYYLKNAMYKFKIPRMHYNACGDFTLMAKEHWLTLRGYPELNIFSLHIDSLLLMATFYSGLKEQILQSPKEIYHLEHAIGSGITPGVDQIILLKRLRDNQIPFLTWRDVINIGQTYKKKRTKGKTHITGNDDSWGLGDIRLPEKVVGG
ncbi:MAG: hypothetical protein MUO73_00235 [Thermoplasmata archaeon]|nr:hypothetical protein [Thermoplasmata archaeon]